MSALKDAIVVKVKDAMKSGRQRERDVFRLILGEISLQESKGDVSDVNIISIIKKLIEGNTETLKHRPNEKLVEENKILEMLLPTYASLEDIKKAISTIANDIRNAKNEGQAKGIAFKALKTTNLVVNGDDVVKVVSEIRS